MAKNDVPDYLTTNVAKINSLPITNIRVDNSVVFEIPLFIAGYKSVVDKMATGDKAIEIIADMYYAGIAIKNEKDKDVKEMVVKAGGIKFLIYNRPPKEGVIYSELGQWDLNGKRFSALLGIGLSQHMRARKLVMEINGDDGVVKPNDFAKWQLFLTDIKGVFMNPLIAKMVDLPDEIKTDEDITRTMVYLFYLNGINMIAGYNPRAAVLIILFKMKHYTSLGLENSRDSMGNTLFGSALGKYLGEKKTSKFDSYFKAKGKYIGQLVENAFPTLEQRDGPRMRGINAALAMNFVTPTRATKIQSRDDSTAKETVKEESFDDYL